MEAKSITLIIMTIIISIITAWGMNSFLNIFVGKQPTASITEKETWEDASDNVKDYFDNDIKENVKKQFAHWTLYDFTALAAALFLIIIAIFFPKVLALGFFSAGILLLIMRFQTTSLFTNIGMWTVGILLISIFSWFKFRKTTTSE